MSGLFSSLANGVKALNAQSAGLESAGRNLANVNNASYARQRVTFGDRGMVQTTLGAQSLGVEAMAITQVRDTLMDQQVVRELSKTSELQTAQSGLENAQAGLGEKISGTTNVSAATNAKSLSETLSAFFTGFQSVAASPTDVGERQTLVQKANALVDQINLTDSRLAQTQGDLTTQAEADIASVNDLLQSIATLNQQIGRAEINAPGTAVDLRDSRQAKLEELAGKISFESRNIPGASGQIELYSRDVNGVEVSLVQGASVTGQLSLSGGSVMVGDFANGLALSGGSIKGALETRDGVVQDLRDSLDHLSAQLVTSVNAAYNPTGATGDFFVATGTSASTLAIESSVKASTLKASDGGAAGDNTIATAVANLANQVFSRAGGDQIDGTFSQHYSTAVTNLGLAISGTNTQLSDQDTIETLVRKQRDSISGVSLDEETADLIKYQRAFEASSRVIKIIDEMLQTVVNLGA